MKANLLRTYEDQEVISEANPGFLIGGGPTLKKGAPTYKICQMFQKKKPHEIKKILVCGEGGNTGYVDYLLYCMEQG